jgi:hypothetical protein
MLGTKERNLEAVTLLPFMLTDSLLDSAISGEGIQHLCPYNKGGSAGRGISRNSSRRNGTTKGAVPLPPGRSTSPPPPLIYIPELLTTTSHGVCSSSRIVVVARVVSAGVDTNSNPKQAIRLWHYRRGRQTVGMFASHPCTK